ncbi:MAG: metallophosphoesterase family protein [Polyangia bacterium]
MSRFTILSAVAALAASAALAAPAAVGDPVYLRLSYIDDASSSMTVTWHTAGPADSEVRYGTSPGDYTSTTVGDSFASSVVEFGHIHQVTLTGLEPETVYYYVAGSEEDGWSTEHSFVTAPPADLACGSFSFVFLGDNRPDETFGGGENWDAILDQAAATDPAFMLNGGDLLIDGDDVGGWLDFLGWTCDVAAEIPLMPTIGNHDNGPGEGDEAYYNQLFSLPRSSGEFGSDTEDYYFFTYANAIFVSLSTETFKGGEIPFQQQADWLDQVLTDNPRKWRIVFYHKPSYNQDALVGGHEPNEESQNAALIPVIDEHHVDLVIASHVHWYERYHPTACATQGEPGSSEPCPVGEGNFADGTVHLVSGGAGAFTIPSVFCPISPPPGRAVCDSSHHYLLIHIEDEVLEYQAWGAHPQNNELFDSFVITKEDEECAAADADTDSDSDSDTDTDIDIDIDSDADADTSDDAEIDGGGQNASEGDDSGSCGCNAPGSRASVGALSALLEAL